MTEAQIAIFDSFLKIAGVKKDDPDRQVVMDSIQEIVLDNKVGIVDGRLALITNVRVRGEEE